MVHVWKIAVPNAAVRMQLARHPANSHGTLRAAYGRSWAIMLDEGEG